jgi:hypothetical protein
MAYHPSSTVRLLANARHVARAPQLSSSTPGHDPLASHIFISRRHYRNTNDTKGGKRREMNARLSFNTACELGFRGSLDEWERLLGAVAQSMTSSIRSICSEYLRSCIPDNLSLAA